MNKIELLIVCVVIILCVVIHSINVLISTSISIIRLSIGGLPFLCARSRDMQFDYKYD